MLNPLIYFRNKFHRYFVVEEQGSSFLQEAKQALALKFEISKTDAEIDQMVYKLYGLTEEEIKIVEGAN